jgi:O-antigen/teichoic acid export membrane protein
MTSRIGALPGSLRSALAPAGHTGALLRGTAGSFLVKVASNALLFASQILFARWLGVEGFGVYVLALAWLSVLVVPARLGFDIATIRFVAAYKGRQEWGLMRGFLSAARLAVLCGSAVVAGLFVVAVENIAPSPSPDLRGSLALAALTIPVLAVVQMQASAVRAMGRVVIGEAAHAIVHPSLLIGFFVAAVWWFGLPAGPVAAMASYLLAASGSLLLLWPLLRRCTPTPARRAPQQYLWREWLTAAPAMMLIAGFSVILSQSAVIVLGAMAGSADAGLFGAAARLAAILQIVSFSLVTAIAPMIARLHAQGAQADMQKAIDAGVRTVFMFSSAAALGLALLGRPLLSLFGNEFIDGYEVLLILLAGQLVWAATAAAGSVLNMTGHQNVSAAILAVAAVANLILCWLLIPPFGPEGAAAATAATLAGSNIAIALWARRATGLRGYIGLTRGSR